MGCRLSCGIVVAIGLLLLAGCDSATRHTVLSTLFDGYPALPPAEEYCSDYVVQQPAKTDEAQGLEPARAEPPDNSSRHKPFAEKKCGDCHDKSQESGLIAPARELCFVCHHNFIRGTQVHGPVAVGECQACHLPHSSSHPSLLKNAREAICVSCHQEDRLAAGMHDVVGDKGLSCTECHDPHFGDSRYFLK